MAKSENLKVIPTKPKAKKIMRTGKCPPGKVLRGNKCMTDAEFAVETLTGMSTKEWKKTDHYRDLKEQWRKEDIDEGKVSGSRKKRRQSKTGRQY